jgi:tetrahedral aminopeptidase
VKDLIKKLTEAWGPSGYEHKIRALIQEEVADLADEIKVDPLGNLICRVGQGGAKVMIAAHMDEIGVMATFAEPSGYLRFNNIGGLILTALRGNRVRFEDGTIGVIGVHGNGGASRTKVTSLSDCYIDVSDGESDALPEIGRPAGFWRETEFRGNRAVGKTMDDRIGCVVAIEAMRQLKALRAEGKELPNEIHFVFTVQEEVGLRGARTAAHTVAPDVALSLDVTGTGDLLNGSKMAVKLGDGAAIKVHDGGLVVPPAVIKWMKDTAEANNIPYQMELLSGGTTDAAAMQLAHSGVPSGCISIPCRFIHTVSETVDLGDVKACINLLVALVSNPA